MPYIEAGVGPRRSATQTPVSITVGSSPFTYTNNDGYDEWVSVAGGTVTAITLTVGGTAIILALLSGGPYHCKAGDAIKITYTGSPTMLKWYAQMPPDSFISHGSGKFVVDDTTGKISTYGNASVAGNGFITVNAAGFLSAQTAVGNVTTFTTPASDGTYMVSAMLRLTATTATTVQVAVTWTDETSTSQSISASLSATGITDTSQHLVRVKASTTITVATSFTVGSSATFDTAGTITQLA